MTLWLLEWSALVEETCLLCFFSGVSDFVRRCVLTVWRIYRWNTRDLLFTRSHVRVVVVMRDPTPWGDPWPAEGSAQRRGLSLEGVSMRGVWPYIVI